MPSELAKKAAGTHIEDAVGKLPPSLHWLTQECRTGSLARVVETFCREQAEPVRAADILVETVLPDALECRIPCACFDHEAAGTFVTEIRLRLNPHTGTCVRLTP